MVHDAARAEIERVAMSAWENDKPKFHHYAATCGCAAWMWLWIIVIIWLLTR